MNINNFYEELLKAIDIYKYLEDNVLNVQELCIQLGISDTYLAHLSYESLDDIPDCVLLYLCLCITKGMTNNDKSIYKNVIEFVIEYNICNKQIVNTICKNNPEREDAVLLTSYKIEFAKQNIEIENREWLIQFAVYLLIIYKEKLKMVEQERELNMRRTSNNNMKMPKMKIYNSEKIFRRYDKPTMSLDHYVQLLEKQEEVMKSMEQNAEEYEKIEVDEEEERKAEERKEHVYKKGYKKDLG